MANNQIDPNQKPNENQLSDEELDQVAGGNIFGDIADVVENAYDDVKDKYNEAINDAMS